MNALDTQPAEASPLDQRQSSMAPGIGLLICFLIVVGGTIASMLISRTPYDKNNPGTWPFFVLFVGVGVVITLITVVRLHAFLALILAAISTGLIAHAGALPQLNAAQPQPHLLNAMAVTASEFGKAAGGIGIVIVLAAVIGMALLESGAADRVVRGFLGVFGEKRAGLALLVSTYIISIPIFFDTLFMLLIPIARALQLRTGKNYLLYVLAICCAGAITHSMVVPHPGPLAMIDQLKYTRIVDGSPAQTSILSVDTGLSIFAGLAVGIIPLTVGWMFAVWLNKRMTVTVGEIPGANEAELRAIMDRPNSQLPSFFMSILPIILPVVLIWIGSAFDVFARQNPATPYFKFLGERHIALIIGTVLALYVLMRIRRLTLPRIADMMGPALEVAGVIILITAAGGAFGAMLRAAGVGDAIRYNAADAPINLIVLAYIVTAVVRIAQGSATVSMMTASGMVAPMMGDMPFHPIYLFLAIGWGSMICSWMNDSGFWVVSRLSGMGEKQTLKSWTVMITIISITGFLTTLLLASVMPMKQ